MGHDDKEFVIDNRTFKWIDIKHPEKGITRVFVGDKIRVYTTGGSFTKESRILTVEEIRSWFLTISSEYTKYKIPISDLSEDFIEKWLPSEVTLGDVLTDE